MTTSEDILANLLNCGVCDIDFLINTLDSFELDFEDVIEEAKSIENEVSLNGLLYVAFNTAGENFKAKVVEFLQDNEGSKKQISKVENFELNIYTNYIDSGFDSFLNDFDITDFSEENIERFLEELE